MQMYKELLISILSDSRVEVRFPELDINIDKIFENKCYNALLNIKQIIADETLEDSECFMRIEKIVNELEKLKIDTGIRHDF